MATLTNAERDKIVKLGGLSKFKECCDNTYCGKNDSRLSDSRPASDVPAWAKANTKPSYTKSEVGLGSVVNTGDSATPVSGGTTKFTTGGAYLLQQQIADIRELFADLKDRLSTMAEGIAALSEELVSENVWKNNMLWGSSMVWPDEDSAAIVLTNKYNNALGWTEGMRWLYGASWPER